MMRRPYDAPCVPLLRAVLNLRCVKPQMAWKLSMPNANGVEVALRLRDLLPSTPVVLYTMFDEVFGKSPVRTLGIAAIVRKSDGVGKLLGRIEALLDAEDALQRHRFCLSAIISYRK